MPKTLAHQPLNLSRPRILIVKLSSFGDVLHALPTLESLRDLYPQARLTWLVEEAFAPLLQGHPALDEVWVAPRLRPAQLFSGAHRALLGGLRRRLRSQTFDLVIDLQGLLKSALWVALARSPRKVGYDRTREWSYRVLTERVPPYDREAHAVARYFNLAHHLGAPAAPPRFRLGLTPTTDLGHLVSPDRPLAVLHPGARWPTKLWPAPSWARLGDWLCRDRGFQVAVTGSPADRDLAAQITGQMREKALNLAGRTSLAELAGLLTKARLAVTADTGPMHLAAALGTPVVAVFGPTAPWRTGPFGEGHQMVRLAIPCSPCFKRQCPEPRCLTELPPEMAQAACEKILFPTEING
jgi:heptosyltransferase I